MKLLSVPEVAERLGFSQKKVWAMIYRRELEIVRIGRSVRLPESSINELVERSTVPAQVA
jgi:excisionase family DNA binding protein